MSRPDTRTHEDSDERSATPAHGNVLAPYAAQHDHLTDLLARHDWLLKRHIARGHVHKPDDVLGFAAISEHEVQRLLNDPTHSSGVAADVRMIEWTLEQLDRQIAVRVELSEERGIRLPIIELAKRFTLTTREVDLLVACLAVELEPRYERVYGFLHDDMSCRLASPGLAIGLYFDSLADQMAARALLSAQAPLRYYRLIEVMDDHTATPWLSRSMRVDERIVSFLVGDDAVDARIARFVTRSDAGVDAVDGDANARDDDETVDRIVRLAAAPPGNAKPLIYLHGSRHAGADVLVHRAARQLDVSVMTVDADLLVESASDVEEALFLVFREGLLSQTAVYLRNIDRALESLLGASRCRALRRAATEMGSIVFASGEQAWSWQLPAEPVVLRVVEITRESSLARRIQVKHRWTDLVLPSAQLDQLSAICSQAKHASVVYDQWRFDRKLSLGRGLNAMFTGQPGTGKTMAAEAIAADLGVELLKIDMSQIVAKFIGETEKNLRQLFDQVASANAILFFDEADALLGRRSDVKDAHDRYANTETAYLLQKMEEYPGITILATSLRQNVDAALTQRMRFIVDFPFPEEEDRLRIWKSVWPSEVPLGPDIDLVSLARQFRLAGGSIRNVALGAAFLAAEQNQAVSMRHLMLATKRELQKMRRLVNDEEHRSYG